MKITIEAESWAELRSVCRIICPPEVVHTTVVENVIVQGNADADMSRSIDILALTVRAANCLKAEEIKTLGQLVLHSSRSLMGVPNLGRKSINEIKEKLSTIGLSLRQ